MGARGPAPKPAWALRRRNSPGTDVVVMQGAVPMPKPPRGLRKIAKDWYLSLGESAQAAYFEPSDWAAAAVTAYALNTFLSQYTHEANAGLFKGVWQAMEKLGTTEESRRRMHIEVTRQFEPEHPSTTLEDYKRMIDEVSTPSDFEAERRRRFLEDD